MTSYHIDSSICKGVSKAGLYTASCYGFLQGGAQNWAQSSLESETQQARNYDMFAALAGCGVPTTTSPVRIFFPFK
jgi:hypothetical protein